MRRPWYWMAFVVLCAVVATTLIVETARARVVDTTARFDAAQSVRLGQSVRRIDAFFADAIQLVNVGARQSAVLVGRFDLERSMIRSLYVSRHDLKIYGLGAFFAAHGFGNDAVFVSDYARGRGTVVEIRNAVDRFRSPGDDYRRYRWWQTGMKQPDRVEIEGPYTEDVRSFISIVRAISVNDKPVGVMSVDTLTPTFREMLQAGLQRGDVAWVSFTPTAAPLVATGTVPAGNRRVQHAALTYSHASVFISSDSRYLSEATWQSWSIAAALLVAIWTATIAIGVTLWQRWEADSAKKHLEEQLRVREAVERELRVIAYTDDVTGLPNRAAFLGHLRELLERREAPCAVMLIDLDRFNIINETLGHAAGDELLVIVADRLRTLAGSWFAARLGGDEFSLAGACEHSLALSRAEEILLNVAGAALIRGQTVYPRASGGVVTVDESYERAEDVLRDADIAMYAAKSLGRARASLFDSDMRMRVAVEAELESDLRRALERDEIVPYYQPIVALGSSDIVGFEALARWVRPDGTVASGFVPFCEERNFAQRIDLAILRRVCSQLATILALFPTATVSANISTIELGTPGFDGTMRDLLAHSGIEPASLKLEITETATMTGGAQARETLEALRVLGFSLVLDDFGTGYSSLSYLQRLPISAIKIDRSFVEHLPHDERSIEIVRSIVALAQTFALPTTAEGIETLDQLTLLRELGVDNGQGFFFSPAVPLSSLASLVPAGQTTVASKRPS